jgi:hypothetical protein
MGNSCSTKSKHGIYKYTGWWFGTFFIFSGNSYSNWLWYFSEGLKPPTSIYILFIYYIIYVYIIYIYILYRFFQLTTPFEAASMWRHFSKLYYIYDDVDISRIIHSNHMWICDSLHLPMVFRFGCQPETLWWIWLRIRMLDPSMFGWFNANYCWYHIIGVILIYADPNQYPCTWNGCFSTSQLGLSVNGLYNQNWWLFSIGKWRFIRGFRATV